MENQQTKSQFRWNKLPKPGYQLQLLGTLLALCVLSLVVQSLVVSAQFAKVAHLFAYQDVEAMPVMTAVLGRSLLVAGLLVLPALSFIIVHRTHRIAGPIYRFEQHLKSAAKGEWPGECRIRRGDDHQQLCKLINEGLEGARELGRKEALEEFAKAAEEKQAA